MNPRPNYVRNPELVAYAVGDRLHLLRPGLPETVIGPTDTAAICAVLEAVATPVTEEELAELLEPATSRLLVDRRVLVELSADDAADSEADPLARKPRCGHLVLGVSGTVACTSAVSALAPLLHGFAEKVDVIVTDAAARFVRPEAFAYLGVDVWTDDYVPRGEVNVPHIHLAHAADLIVVWPTSAATIAKLAHGTCNDLLSLTICASAATTVLFPAMNHAMWANAAVARNVAQLRDDGYVIIEPGAGREVSNRGGGAIAVGAVGSGGFGVAEILESVLRATADSSDDEPAPRRPTGPADAAPG